MSGIYDKGRELFLAGDGDFDADDFRVVPVDATYVYSAAHDALDDVPSGSRCATPVVLAGKTTAGGIAAANDVTFPEVTAGKTITGFVVFQYNATESLARLAVYIDKDTLGGAISIPTNGSDIIIRFGGGTKNIFRL